MTDVLTVTLPLPPNLLNTSKHWRARAREKNAYYEAANLALTAQLKGKLEGWPGRVHAEITFYLWNKMDKDNRTARLKYVWDSLVRYGAWDLTPAERKFVTRGRLLIDDSDEFLDHGIPEQVVDRKNQRVVLTLTATREAA